MPGYKVTNRPIFSLILHVAVDFYSYPIHVQSVDATFRQNVLFETDLSDLGAVAWPLWFALPSMFSICLDLHDNRFQRVMEAFPTLPNYTALLLCGTEQILAVQVAVTTFVVPPASFNQSIQQSIIYLYQTKY